MGGKPPYGIFRLKVIHPSMANVSKADLSQKLGKMYKAGAGMPGHRFSAPEIRPPLK